MKYISFIDSLEVKKEELNESSFKKQFAAIFESEASGKFSK